MVIKMGNYTSMRELIDEICHIYKQRVAFEELSSSGLMKTYDELLEDVINLANIFAYLPFKRIGVVANNSYFWVVTYLGVLYNGGIAIIIDRNQEKNAKIRQIVHSDTELLITDDLILLDEIRKSKIVKEYIYIENDRKYLYTQIHRLINKYGKQYRGLMDINEHDICTLMYTSGTTSNPRGVMLTHKNIILDILSQCKAVKRGKRYLAVLPMSHCYQCFTGILGPLYDGALIGISMDRGAVFNDIQKFSPDTLMLVPFLLDKIYKEIQYQFEKDKRKSNKIDIIRAVLGTKIKYIISGGSHLDDRYCEFFKEYGISLFNGYGMTECSCLISVNNETNNRINSVGKIINSCIVKIDPLTKEILVNGDIIMAGYYKDEKATSEVLTNGWLHTGDIGELDDENFLYIQGRIKNIIVLSNGYKVNPEEMETDLKRITGIEDLLISASKQNPCQLAVEVYLEKEEDNNKKVIEEQILLYNRELPFYKKISDIIYRQKPFRRTNTKKIIRE